MALRGTLDTFALPDVLRLLAGTHKSGRLRITGDRGTGSIWVGDGAITGVEATHAPHAVEPGDALFELLRFQEGSFTFDAGATAEPTIPAQGVEGLLTQAETLLEEWRDIERVVPSMDLWVSLARTLPAPNVAVDQDRWSTIVAVGAGATVRRIGDELCLGELPVSRAIVRLVDDGLVEISTVAPVTPPRSVPDVAVEAFAPLPSPEPNADVVEGVIDTGAEMPDIVEEPDPVGEVVPPIAADAELVLDDAPAPRPGPKARRPRAAAAVEITEETGLFVPLDLPGRDGPASYDAPSTPVVADRPLTAQPGPADELDDLAAAFPGLASRLVAGQAVDPDDAEIAAQLASLSPKAAKAILSAASSAATVATDGGEDPEQPISRGLLLKFLSSVKT